MRDDYYELLALPRNATAREIARAFRRASLKLHPDKVAASEESEQLAAAEKFAALREAYDTLSDPVAREKYDQRAKWMSSHPDQVRPATCSGLLLGTQVGTGLLTNVAKADLRRAATAGSPQVVFEMWDGTSSSRPGSRSASNRKGAGLSWTGRSQSRPVSRIGAEPWKLDPNLVTVRRVRNDGMSKASAMQMLPLAPCPLTQSPSSWQCRR
mmetsp:Transcript_28239/g.53022  ORF Transcript_28239/g.53022 Transcript_28239/m.53022 type:complete len:212 (-) Transcript_28239:109-744(-)